MRLITFLLLAIMPMLVQAQPATEQQEKQQSTIDYSIDAIQKDSFFLIETITVVRESQPRAAVNQASMLLRAPDELTKYVAKMLSEAEDLKDKAAEALNAAKLLEGRARLIEERQRQLPWWGADFSIVKKQ